MLRDVEGLDYREIAEATVARFADKDALSKLKDAPCGKRPGYGCGRAERIPLAGP
jgi:hypothetical protein